MGPTIMIGLGGVGSEIVAMIEKRLYDLPADSFREMEPLLRFAIIDTDVNALRERKRKGFRGAAVQLSDNMTVEQYLYYDPASTRWFPPCQILSTKTMTEGAGQVRAISRLTLDLALQKQDCFRPLYSAIDELHLLRENASGQPTKVGIVTSLSGGTGSGIFLPFAMHLQEYLRKNYRNTEPVFKGFFVMPSMFDFFAEEAERRSLNANGYASIKELNAFSMLRDRLIDLGQYPFLKIELPDGHERTRTYRTSPYDLCFLFEKQNQDDKHLNGFAESKRNVADSVWMQMVNPVLEKNGSLEDNLYKIVSTASKTKRYERFAGMGIAHLVYPYKAMEPYFSMVMADAILLDDWYAADAAWEKWLDQLAVNAEPVSQMKKEEFYIDFADGKPEWAAQISAHKNGACVQNFLKEVDKIIEGRSDGNKGVELQKAENIFTSVVNQDSPDAWTDSVITAIKDGIECFQQEKQQVTAKNSESLCRQLFEDLNTGAKNRAKWDLHRFEHWILEGSDPKTPVENRYFLAQLLKELNVRYKEAERQYEEKERNIQKADDIFDKLQRQSRREFKKNRSQYTEELRSVLKAISERAQLDLQMAIYRELRKVAQGLWNVYEVLLKKYTLWVWQEKAELRKNLIDSFEDSDGRTVRLVCASEVCLNKMETLIRAGARNKDYGGAFAREFCLEVLKQREQGEDADADLLKEFWNRQYLKSAGSELDVDVLSALENEACWEYEAKNHKPLQKSSLHYNAAIKQYMEDHAFHAVREIFVRAFLRIPNIKQRHTLQMCIYPACIPKDNVLLQEIVREQLDAKHGVEDTESGSEGKYQIDFYRAVFGVSASEVSTFLCEDPESPIISGDSYLDYMAMIGSLDWQNRRSNFLTPHIDWRWHKTSAMPDLSAKFDRRRKVDLLLAVFYGLLSRTIQRNPQNEYTISPIQGQSFDRPVRDLYDLVDFMDESPVIKEGLLEELRISEKTAAECDAEKVASIIADVVEQYCIPLLRQNCSQSELAAILAEVIFELIYMLWINGRSRKPENARKEIAKVRKAINPPEKEQTDQDLNGLVQKLLNELADGKAVQWLDVRMKQND